MEVATVIFRSALPQRGNICFNLPGKLIFQNPRPQIISTKRSGWGGHLRIPAALFDLVWQASWGPFIFVCKMALFLAAGHFFGCHLSTAFLLPGAREGVGGVLGEPESSGNFEFKKARGIDSARARRKARLFPPTPPLMDFISGSGFRIVVSNT